MINNCTECNSVEYFAFNNTSKICELVGRNFNFSLDYSISLLSLVLGSCKDGYERLSETDKRLYEKKCGNGVLNTAEEYDYGNLFATDGCIDTCIK